VREGGEKRRKKKREEKRERRERESRSELLLQLSNNLEIVTHELHDQNPVQITSVDLTV
jgi:hypothetical protein